MRTPRINMNIFKERRRKLGALIPGTALILPAHPEAIRNHDVHHPYRQDSNLYYLTGFEEPESILLFRPGLKPETVLFVRPRDVERETWDGFRYGPEGTVRNFAADAAYEVSQFKTIAADLLADVDHVYYSLFQNDEFDQVLGEVLNSVKSARRRSGRGILTIEDSYPLLGEMRLRKSEYEIETLRRACEISSVGHIDVMRATRPGVNERALHGEFIRSIFSNGAAREGYGTIVAGGASATTLHYVFNDQVLKDGDLLLVDAGAEFDYYTGDITRTFPVNGKFSAVQKRVYEQVLDVQKQLIAMVKPGLPYADLQKHTIDALIDVMIREKIVSGTKESVRESGVFRKYYPHGVSHYLGSDVHDAGTVEVRGEPRPLEPGMVFTIEPGLYIPADDKDAPAEVRGIGIRIEDNILVTADGYEVLTAKAPKEIKDLEDVIGRNHK